MRCSFTCLVWFFILIAIAAAQQPVFTAESVVNAASYAGVSSGVRGIAPGSLATIFGSNLAVRAAQSQGFPLPRSLEGTTVTVDGAAAPLWYVSPNQINFQVPGGLFPTIGITSRIVPVVVATPVGRSDTVSVNATLDAIGLFTQEAGACGRAAALNVNADRSVTLNTPGQSVSPGGFISLFGTGLGPGLGNSHPPDGEPAGPLQAQTSPSVRLGLSGFDRFVPNMTYGGRAPGYAGVDQINFQVPEDAPEGCSVPVKVWGLASSSQPVTLSIRRGGGQCQDAEPDRFGVIRWSRTAVVGPASSSVSEKVTASFTEAPSSQITFPINLPEQNCSCPGGRVSKPGPDCPGTGPRTLDAGVLTVGGMPELTSLPAAASGGEVTYTADLPAGSIQRKLSLCPRPGVAQSAHLRRLCRFLLRLT